MGDAASVSSVGRALSNNVAFSVAHPLYRQLSEAMERKVNQLAAVRGASRAASALSFVTVSLDSVDMAVMSTLYPEFRYAAYPMARPVHPLYVQVRRLSLEWMLLQADRLTDTVVVVGTPLVAALTSKFKSVTMVVDQTSPVAVHERYAASLDAYRIFSSTAQLTKTTGVQVSRLRYDQHLRREGVRFATAFSGVKGDVLCVDGLAKEYSAWQVALMMADVGADVAFGSFPYHPNMLLSEQGEIPGFGVHYQFTDEELLLKYPEGVAGATTYSRELWRSWLAGHTFTVGVGARKKYYQLELMKHRGCAMLYRLVALPEKPENLVVAHALELPFDEPMYVVNSSHLKSLHHDPVLRDSWDVSSYMVSRRLVDRVYQFCMQLPREQFTRYAVRKQLHVVNDRVTIEGTSVQVKSPLGQRMVDALVVDIHAKAFVDRYTAGTLLDDVRQYVDSVMQFSSLSRVQRLWRVVATMAYATWDVTLQPLNDLLRTVSDSFRRWLSGTVTLDVSRFDLAPSYVLSGALVAKQLRMSGGNVVASELTRRAAMQSVGFFAGVVRTLAEIQGPLVNVSDTTFRVANFSTFDTNMSATDATNATVGLVRELNEMDEEPVTRRALEIQSAVRASSMEREMHFNAVADPVEVLNVFHSKVLPGVAEQNLEYDTASISMDPQDRVLTAPYLRLPRYFGDPPRSKQYYKSRLRALNVPKRQQTLQELLSAIAARNLNAPQVALPQDDEVVALEVWENFLNVACVPEARNILKTYQEDTVGLSESAFREWAEQSTPEKLAQVRKELEELGQSLKDMPVQDYLVMLKADAKPTLSKKPLDTRTEPQVIVYHEKALSSLFSSIFRVIVRRFLALLKPNYHVNLLKDTKDMEAFVRGVHPFDTGGSLKYLENDFSKFDKSQGRFVFVLEQLVFQELGMNREYLRQWLGGHVECSLRAVSLGLSLHVLYQRKSGDATTSFGNVLLNVLSVSFAYGGSEVVWALFMGDDSLICVRGVAAGERAVQVLAEVFNLGAKVYMTDSPYFASNFVLIDAFNQLVSFVPDPVKRVERWSMAVSAIDPQWRERYVSGRDSMSTYLNCAKTVLLPKLVAERYGVPSEYVGGVADAVATVVASEGKFREMWEELPTWSNY